MTCEKLRVALIGVGAIARSQHLPAWCKLPEVKVVAVADPSPTSLALVDNSFDVARRVTDYRELLDDPMIDVVDICAPTALHAELTTAALQAGKHVLCEKPLATTRDDAAKVLDAWRTSGKKLMIAQHMRFEPSVQQLRTYLNAHPPGDVYYARAQWLRRRRLPARPGFMRKDLAGGGPLYDLGVHMLDLAWWMMDCPTPRSVSGAAFDKLVRREDIGSEWGRWDPKTIDVEDFGAGFIRFENGAVLSLEVSWLGLQPEEDFNRLQMYGTRAGIVWPDNLILGETDLVPWDVRLAPLKGEKAHHEVIHRFARSVLDDTPPPIPPEQSATGIAILESLYRSSVTGREEIITPFDCSASFDKSPAKS